MRYNPPPSWPKPPDGWVPPHGWAPQPDWPPPPPGWVLWLPDADTRPWPARHKALTGVGIFVVLAVIAGAVGGGSSKAPGPVSAPKPTTSRATTPPAPLAPATADLTTASKPTAVTTSTAQILTTKASPHPKPVVPAAAINAAFKDQDYGDTLTTLKVVPMAGGRYAVHAVVKCHETLIDQPTQAIYEAAEQLIFSSYAQQKIKISDVIVSVTYPTLDAYGKTSQTKMITEELGAVDGYKLNLSDTFVGYASINWGVLWHQTYTNSLMVGTAPSR